jgi:hypothetical protein
MEPVYRIYSYLATVLAKIARPKFSGAFQRLTLWSMAKGSLKAAISNKETRDHQERTQG